MAVSAFEPNLSGTNLAGLFNGHMNSVVTTEPQGGTPSSVINIQDAWHVVVEWEFHGTLIRGGLLRGKWHVQAVLESIGSGSELIVADRFVDIATGGVATALGRKYNETFLVGPNVPSQPGAYWLATIITSIGVDGIPGPFAGSFESPTIMFYDDIEALQNTSLHRDTLQGQLREQVIDISQLISKMHADIMFLLKLDDFYARLFAYLMCYVPTPEYLFVAGVEDKEEIIQEIQKIIVAFPEEMRAVLDSEVERVKRLIENGKFDAARQHIDQIESQIEALLKDGREPPEEIRRFLEQ